MSYNGKQNGNGFGTFSGRPIEGQSGRTYYATDTQGFYYDDGYTWKMIGPTKNLIAPKISDFTKINYSATDCAFNNLIGGGINMSRFSTGSSENIFAAVQAVPYTPYQLTVHLRWEATSAIWGGSNPGQSMMGLCFRESSSGKMAVMRFGNGNGVNSTLDSGVRYFSDPNTLHLDLAEWSGLPAMLTPPLWMRIQDDGTNRIYWISGSGQKTVWTPLYEESNTSYLTADQVGFYINPYGSSSNITVVSFEFSDVIET